MTEREIDDSLMISSFHELKIESAAVIKDEIVKADNG